MLYNKKKWYAAEALHETDKYKCSVKQISISVV